MSYKKSRIYQLGYHLALKVASLCRTFPKHEQFALAQQLRNSSRSVVANYVEGYVRQERFKPDHSRFLIYSQGSCDETKFWLELARDIGFLDSDIVSETVSGYEELTQMILAVIGKSRR